MNRALSAKGPTAGLHRNYTTEPDSFRRVEVISGVARRRRCPRSEKAVIVAESDAPGASATAVAVRHRLHRNQIFAWRHQLPNRAALIEGAMPEFVPVALVRHAAREPVCRRSVRISRQARRSGQGPGLDGPDLCLLHKRLEKVRFLWPPVRDEVIRLSAAQLGLLLEGLDWSRLRARPAIAPVLAG